MKPHCAFLSFRLGMTDGVSVVAATWERSLRQLGWTTSRIAGEGDVDHLIPGLAIGADRPPEQRAVAAAVADADLVVVENLLTIPMNLPAARVVARVLAGRPAVLHHHDPPWQRARFQHVTELPVDDPTWRHVTINALTAAQFAERGLAATTIYNGFDTEVGAGDRAGTRRALEMAEDDILVAHPVRAIERKNIPAAVAIAESLDAVYWLPGPAEDGYGPMLDALLARARCRLRRHTLADIGPAASMADLYAAADLVVFPSTWEGFGNPPLEAAIHGRPVVVGRYPVAEELRRFGFWWLDPDDVDGIRAAVNEPPVERLDGNRRLVREQFSIDVVTGRVKALLDEAGFGS
ncbi:MAG: glycosyltransferase family 4 protein [Actinomycetota bacterium]